MNEPVTLASERTGLKLLGSEPGSSGNVNSCAIGSPKFQLNIGHTNGVVVVVVVDVASPETAADDDESNLAPASLVALKLVKSPTSKNPLDVKKTVPSVVAAPSKSVSINPLVPVLNVCDGTTNLPRICPLPSVFKLPFAAKVLDVVVVNGKKSVCAQLFVTVIPSNIAFKSVLGLNP